jgi:hypothetical protein
MDSLSGGIAGLVFGVIFALIRVIEKRDTRSQNGNAPLTRHAWEMRVKDCANHQARQEELSKEIVSAIKEQTGELRSVLNRGFNIEDTQPGIKRPR